MADRLREAGLVLVGKTTMPDFGMLSSGQSSFHGVTRNPGNPAAIPVAPARALVRPARPAMARCTLVLTLVAQSACQPVSAASSALKPSLGRVPINPPYMGRVAGPMTRTVLDAALLMNVIARPDPDHRDFMDLPTQPVDYAAELERFSLKGKRIGVLTEMKVGREVQADVAAAAWECGQLLEQHGARVEPLQPFITRDMLDGICGFLRHAAIWTSLGCPGDARKILPFIVAGRRGAQANSPAIRSWPSTRR